MNSNHDFASEIVVVTGLPRSGTSMMMQMLNAGGLPAFTDDRRKPDEDNPKGYFELEKVKDLRQDNSWIPQARGYAVKVIAQLLEYLPPENYRYLFMLRDLDEIVHSQKAMLERSGKRGGQLTGEQLKAVFKKQLLRAEKTIASSSAPILKINHRSCIDDPQSIAESINHFLDGRLNTSMLSAVVAPELHRQKSY